MGFSPLLSLPPPLFSCDEGNEGSNEAGLALELQEQKNGLNFDGFADGSYVSEKNCQIEEMEGREHDNVHSKLSTRGHWRPAEDARLRDLVAQFGPQNWNLIAEKLQGRSGKSCRLRWFNQLDPRINRKAFTEEEEEMLLSAHKFYGNKWALISRLFPGRTDNAVKNHWHVIMARRQRERSDAYRRRKPSSSFSSPSPHMSINNASRKLVAARNGCYERVGDCGRVFCPMVLIPEADLSGYSGQHSEASATESVGNKMVNGFLPGETEHEREKNIGLTFIDFLGVGAT